MSRKQKIIIGILIIAALFVAAWLIFINLSTDRSSVKIGQNESPTGSVLSGNSTGAESPTVLINNFQKANSGPAAAEAVARSFAERFGSFSNQSDFENIIDLYPFMTARMRVWAEDYIIQARLAAQEGSVYFGITSRALGGKVLKKDGISTVIQVNTSRRETGGSLGEIKEYLQNIELTLVKESGDFWKVDKAEWQK
ncbi:MAG: hypothetical protein Q8M83_00585 [bacterium]|nr:hypothetical protein [bacterium]